MFPFTYTFEREIKDSKTFKNVTDEVRYSIIERGLTDIILADGTIIGENKMFKLDFANKSPLVFSPCKEYFCYNENTRILIYKTNAFYSILFSLIYSAVLFLILHFILNHLTTEIIIASLLFTAGIIIHYSHYISVINKVSKNLNGN
ncbi:MULTISPECIES: hypothetical protein [unclassified Chryseobacterium]|uniref:hypothetical protein n=1 Tax=unclassified Chryseobacterium TaxID=2593645 RepID=UPI00095670A9|nr:MULTISPECIES: hypothetical protein [unclassified Chryseobacterium]SIR70416.1 hypothetical protein SAMN05880573_1363 [Chryseobacterium sp. RU33C]